MQRLIIIFLVFLLPFAGKGQQISDFTLPNVVDGQDFTLSSWSDARAVVVIFYSGKCAYGNYYLSRIKSLMAEFKPKKGRFLLINANNSNYVPEESPAAMREFAREHNLPVYLADKEQQVKNMLGATRTPEVFVLKPSQGQYTVIYQGAIDDNPQSASDVNHPYLRDALLNLLANKKINVNQTRPVGCLIK